MDPISILGTLGFVLSLIDFFFDTVDSVNDKRAGFVGFESRFQVLKIKLVHFKYRIELWRRLWGIGDRTPHSREMCRLLWGQEDEEYIGELIRQISEDTLWIKTQLFPFAREDEPFKKLKKQESTMRQRFVLVLCRQGEFEKRLLETDEKITLLVDFSKQSLRYHHPSLPDASSEKIRHLFSTVNITKGLRRNLEAFWESCASSSSPSRIILGTPPLEKLYRPVNSTDCDFDFFFLDSSTSSRISCLKLVTDEQTPQSGGSGSDPELTQILMVDSYPTITSDTYVTGWLPKGPRERRDAHRLRLATAAAELSTSAGVLAGTSWVSSICTGTLSFASLEDGNSLHVLREPRIGCDCSVCMFRHSYHTCPARTGGCRCTDWKLASSAHFFLLGQILCELATAPVPAHLSHGPSTRTARSNGPVAWRDEVLNRVQQRTKPGQFWKGAVRHCFDVAERGIQGLEHVQDLEEFSRRVVTPLSKYRQILQEDLKIRQMRVERRQTENKQATLGFG